MQGNRNVNLTPELERLVHRRVKSGRYNSASEVVREGLRLLEQRDLVRQLQLKELTRKVRAGLESLNRGEGLDGEEFFRALEREEAGLRQRKRKRA